MKIIKNILKGIKKNIEKIILIKYLIMIVEEDLKKIHKEMEYLKSNGMNALNFSTGNVHIVAYN